MILSFIKPNNIIILVANGTGKNEVTRDSTRTHRSRLEMKRTSSEGKALDYDEPVKESKHDNYRSKAKTHVSVVIRWSR